MDYTPTKEIAKEIRETLKGIETLKLSVTSDYNSINVSIIEFQYPVVVGDNDGRLSVNNYYYMESEKLTREAKTVFQLVDEIIKKYHWDKSDSMTDYFSCAFYYNYSIGKFDKPFKLVQK